MQIDQFLCLCLQNCRVIIALWPYKRAQKWILNLTNNSSHCEECAVKKAIYFMASCGCAAWIGIDNHANRNNGCRYTADNPSENVGLLQGKNFWLWECLDHIKFFSKIIYFISVNPWIREEKWPLRYIKLAIKIEIKIIMDLF